MRKIERSVKSRNKRLEFTITFLLGYETGGCTRCRFRCRGDTPRICKHCVDIVPDGVLIVPEKLWEGRY